MRYPVPEQYLLMGGGAPLALAAGILCKRGRKVLWATSERQVEETVLSPKGPLPLSKIMSGLVIEPLVFKKASEVTASVGPEAIDRTMPLSFGAPWLFGPKFLAAWKGRIWNFHSTRLPVDRGGGGMSWPILQGGRKGSLTVHLIDGGVDTGDIVRMEHFIFPESCRTPSELTAHMLTLYPEFIESLLDRLEAGEDFPLTQQDEGLSTYWPRLNTASNGWIDWRWKAEKIQLFIHAFSHPHPGAQTILGDQTVSVLRAEVSKEEGPFHPFQAGLIFRKDPGALLVACPGGALRITEAKAQDGSDLIASVGIGARLHTPRTRLDAARTTRARYKPAGLAE